MQYDTKGRLPNKIGPAKVARQNIIISNQ